MSEASEAVVTTVDSGVSIVRLHGEACWHCGAVSKALRAAGQVVVRGCSRVWVVRSCGCRDRERATRTAGQPGKTRRPRERPRVWPTLTRSVDTVERTTRSGAGALVPDETEPQVLVHLAADRRLAAEHWLLSTLSEDARRRARTEWTDHRLAMLPLGTLFSVVRLPENLVLALVGGRIGIPSSDVDDVLAETLDGGPVICDPVGRRYYVLVPASMPRTWHQAAEEWSSRDVDLLGNGTYLGVPRVDVVEPGPQRASYWSVPMASPAELCPPLTVARLIAAGVHVLGEEAGADG